MLNYFKALAMRYRPLVFAYWAIRDAWIMQRQKPQLTPYGFKLMGHSGMQVGTFEAEEIALIKHYLGSVDVCVDVGANIGLYTCLARSQGKHTIAIEPLQQNLSYLYANLRENGWNDVEVYPLGMSRKPGIAKLFGAGTGASLLKGWAGASPWFENTISLSTIDILLSVRFNGQRLLIKMDVEGVEYEALLGAQRTLAMSPRPIWLVEICLNEHHPAGLNPNYTKTFELFWQHGYEAYTAGQDQKLVSPSDVQYAISSPGSWSVEGINFLFLSKL